MLNKLISYTLLLFFGLKLMQCVPPSDEIITDVSFNLKDPVVRKIYNFQDEQQYDSLKVYFSHKNANYRYLTAQSFSATKNTDYLDSLYKLLTDSNYDVRAAAAYSIGQIGDSKSAVELISAFVAKDTFDIDNIANRNILEAIGKTGDLSHLRALATVTTYRKNDTLLLEGQTRAIYNFGLRNIVTPEATDLMVNYVTNDEYPTEVRLIASHYLSRAKNIDLTGYKFRLLDLLNKDSNANIRMAIAIAIGKIPDEDALQGLKNKLEQEKDYRVICNILRAMNNYEYPLISETIFRRIKDKDPNVASVAADLLINKGDKRVALSYKDLITENQDWGLKAKIYTAILKNTPIYYTNSKALVNTEIEELITKTSNRYEKAAYIKALGHDPFNYEKIMKYADTNSEILNTACVEALNSTLASENFINAFGYSHKRIRLNILNFLKSKLETGDVGICSSIAEILKNPEYLYNTLIDSTNFIDSAMMKMNLPKDIEGYNALGDAKAFLTGKKYTHKTPDYNHPIDWLILNNVTDTTRAIVKTNKGNITFKLFPKTAPGSVANFLKLATEEFYKDKSFHRVVQNFVIQGGCPRGDGYGALEYSIRSELPQRYYDDQGYVGMASAGNHTEGTQWFITHSPTPHLDGKYTIFAKVVEGMDVVHSIQVGDKIENIIITYR
jgi:cyclophilin family peptidyl-prolyl cis-trans isomerase/HEAT repeat protein